MATCFSNVSVSSIGEDGKSERISQENLDVECVFSDGLSEIRIMDEDRSNCKCVIPVNSSLEHASISKCAVVICIPSASSYHIRFSSLQECSQFLENLKLQLKRLQNSPFEIRTDSSSAEQYFQFYGYLSQQQNMMQDYIRTATYQRAMLENPSDFTDKVVLDVGAGSGILSFFAIQAGAKKVYAIEASSMALHCQTLVSNNKLDGRIEVIAGKVEEVSIPEQVDMIISEPMGYMLYNERMLESYLHAKKWLKPKGKMFPTQGDLHITPFTDESLYMEQISKANFWYQDSFHGVNLSELRNAAVTEYFRQPIVDTFDVQICMAKPLKHSINFLKTDESDLHKIEIPLKFVMQQSGTVHGLAFWFDVAFLGTDLPVWLSTSPTQALTHWYQVRCLLVNPIFVKSGQTLNGKVILTANQRQSYDVDMELCVQGTHVKACNNLDLKNPFFRYTGQAPNPPPGTSTISPTDAFWNSQEQQASQENTLSNGNAILDPSMLPIASAAPINPGSIPAVTISNNWNQAHLQTRTSIGGGLAPNFFNQTTISANGSGTSSTAYPISNQFMIGDYVVPNNMLMSNQNFKASNI